MRFLCVSDIHGHAERLAKVIAEAQVHGFDQVLACGDHLFPGPDPLAVWQQLMDHRAVCVQGVGDRALARLDPEKLSADSPEAEARLARLRETHQALGQLIVTRLGRLPTSARLPLENGQELLAVHGSPQDFSEPFTPDMTDEEISALLADDPADIVICGGSHIAFQRQFDHVRLVGVGSVGDSPSPGWAQAAIVESTRVGTVIKQLDVEVPV